MKKTCPRFKFRFVIYLTLLVFAISLFWLQTYRPMHLADALGMVGTFSDFSEHRNAFNNIQKYKYAMQHDIPQNLQPDGRYKDCVWTLWLQGEENAPQVIKNCINSMRKYLNNRRLIVLDKKNLSQYVTFPDYVWDKYKKGLITHTFFSDIVRYCLLYKYGGIWLDATVLLTGAFPNEILNQDFFMFSEFPVLRFCKFLTTTWLMKSQAGNPLLKDVINLCFEYWRNERELIDYYLVFLFFTLAVENDPEARIIFEKMPYHREQYHFFSFFSYSDDTLQKFIQYSQYPIHKLTYKDTLTMQAGVISKQEYEEGLFRFFNREDALEQLQKMMLAEDPTFIHQ